MERALRGSGCYTVGRGALYELIVKGRVERVKVFTVKFILSDIECFTETLEVDDFTFTQEA